ncbi:CPBP family intramembrane glutamic endopeptidase [Streptococcus marmotae]
MNQGIIMNDLFIHSILVGGIAVAFAEELVFRGFLQKLFQDRFGLGVACLIPSFIFATLHLFNGKLDLIETFLLLVAGTSVGTMFALIRIESHSLLNSWILHVAWNSMTSLIAIGTINNPETIATLILPSSTPLLTGGQYGVDITLPAMLGYLLVAGFAWRKIGNVIKEDLS